LLTEHGDISIAIDIMYINKIPFMMATSRAINFGTAEMGRNETKSTILKSINKLSTHIMDVVSISNKYSVTDNLNIRKNTEAQA